MTETKRTLERKVAALAAGLADLQHRVSELERTNLASFVRRYAEEHPDWAARYLERDE